MEILWLVPALPLAGFLVLALAGRALPRPAAAAVGAGSVGLSMAAALYAAVQAIPRFPSQGAAGQLLWSWFQADGLQVPVGLYLDPLSLVMILVVTVVGFLIHLYSARFMAGDEGYARFFAYMNLFVGSMLILVLADHLLLLFLGWEGVGLCSYLLIGFWYRDPANVRAANKAFIVTRIGDTGFLIGLLLLFFSLGTLGVQETLQQAARQWAPGSGLAVAAAALLLAGALGKSAQLPLQTWLPDAMAGPTPVSALIHAATMVTAGVYLIARAHPLFELAPPVLLAVAVIGAATLLLAGVSATTQHDIKRVLAYSTISQVGYMFLALGVAAWPAAIFHLVTHAFFKSLLFLGAGVLILVLEEEHDLFRMGGLWKRLPVTFWTMLVAALSLAGLPPLTAGFYSKEWILAWVYAAGPAGTILWLVALLGVFTTSIYAFRLLFLAFLGPLRREPERRPGALMIVPLVILAVPAALIGFLETPRTLGGIQLFFPFIRSALPMAEAEPAGTPEALLQALSEAAALLGVGVAWLLARASWRAAPQAALAKPSSVSRMAPQTARAVPQSELRTASDRQPALAEAVRRFWFAGWGFDWLYDHLLVRPYVWLARANRDDAIDWIFRAVGAASRWLGRRFSLTETGRLREYALALAAGAAAILALVVLL